MSKRPDTEDDPATSDASTPDFEDVVAALLKVDPTGIAGKHKAKGKAKKNQPAKPPKS